MTREILTFVLCVVLPFWSRTCVRREVAALSSLLSILCIGADREEEVCVAEEVAAESRREEPV